MQLTSQHTGPGPRTRQTPLNRCLVDGDLTAASNDLRRRCKALGISFTLEAVAVTLLIVAPLLTSIAQPSFSRTEFVPFAFSASHAPNTAPHTSHSTHVGLNRLSKAITYPIGIRPSVPHSSEEPDNEIPGGDLLISPV